MIYREIIERAKELLIHAKELMSHPFGMHWEINSEGRNILMQALFDGTWNADRGMPVQPDSHLKIERLLGRPISVVEGQSVPIILYINRTPFGNKPMMLGVVVSHEEIALVDFKDVFGMVQDEPTDDA